MIEDVKDSNGEKYISPPLSRSYLGILNVTLLLEYLYYLYER